jgi:hypothetical protein
MREEVRRFKLREEQVYAPLVAPAAPMMPGHPKPAAIAAKPANGKNGNSKLELILDADERGYGEF